MPKSPSPNPLFTKQMVSLLWTPPLMSQVSQIFLSYWKKNNYLFLICKGIWRENPHLILHQDKKKSGVFLVSFLFGSFLTIATNLQRKDWFWILRKMGGSLLFPLLVLVEQVFIKLSLTVSCKNTFTNFWCRISYIMYRARCKIKIRDFLFKRF